MGTSALCNGENVQNYNTLLLGKQQSIKQFTTTAKLQQLLSVTDWLIDSVIYLPKTNTGFRSSFSKTARFICETETGFANTVIPVSKLVSVAEQKV